MTPSTGRTSKRLVERFDAEIACVKQGSVGEKFGRRTRHGKVTVVEYVAAIGNVECQIDMLLDEEHPCVGFVGDASNNRMSSS